MDTVQCAKCGAELTLDNFYRSGERRYDSWCKECRRADGRERYACKKLGELRKASALAEQLGEGFWENINTLGVGCWRWNGTLDANGYARWKGKAAHRIVWELVHGPLGQGQVIFRTCGNADCCNYEHMYVGTRQDIARTRRAPRVPAPRERPKPRIDFRLRGERSPFAKITEQQALEICESTDKYADLAARYGISESQVGKIRRGEKWGHLLTKRL